MFSRLTERSTANSIQCIKCWFPLDGKVLGWEMMSHSQEINLYVPSCHKFLIVSSLCSYFDKMCTLDGWGPSWIKDKWANELLHKWMKLESGITVLYHQNYSVATEDRFPNKPDNRQQLSHTFWCHVNCKFVNSMIYFFSLAADTFSMPHTVIIRNAAKPILTWTGDNCDGV